MSYDSIYKNKILPMYFLICHLVVVGVCNVVLDDIKLPGSSFLWLGYFIHQNLLSVSWLQYSSSIVVSVIGFFFFYFLHV